MRLSLCIACSVALLAGCKTPPAASSNGVNLPVPPGLVRPGRLAAPDQPIASRYLSPDQTQIDLVPMKVVYLTFENSPVIKTAYLTYLGEKARYDYILATWTATTPGLSVGPGWDKTKDITDTVANHQTQKVSAFLERNFLDTSKVRVFGEATNEDTVDAHAYHPAVGGLLHFPLWGSREALQRTSDHIFQQNRVNDALLDYVKKTREQITTTVWIYFNNLRILQQSQARQRQVDDLQAIGRRMEAAGSPPADRQRIVAETSTATTDARSLRASYAVEMEWLKTLIGLPFGLNVTLIEESFDPFGEVTREQLLSLSVRADPEIATLQNAIKDAEVQLALARKGRLDVAADVGATADLRGTGYWTGQTEYQANAALTVGFIDPRISTSLAREASASIAQYQHAIRRRNNEVYVDTIEPMLKIRSELKSLPETRANLQRYQRDFQAAIDDYFAGRMSVDDLIRRRRSLLDEECKLMEIKAQLGQNMANLAGATGKYFELLQQEAPASQAATLQPATSQPADASVPTSQPETTLKQETHP